MKPMRACKIKNMSKLRYPLYASYKLDGIRAVVDGGALLSKNMKRIPNLHCQKLFGMKEFNGMDGELVVGPPNVPGDAGEDSTMRKTTSGVMSRDGQPDVCFYLFDDFSADYGWFVRWKLLKKRSVAGSRHFKILEQRVIRNEAELLAFEEEALNAGYEGLMLRAGDAPYKHGTATENEGYLLKMKRFEDAEATILGYEELMHNGNDKGADGKRSSHKAGLKPLGTLGSLRVVGLNGRYEGIEFTVPVANPRDRDYIWSHRPQCMGSIIKFKYFPSGAKAKPRFPTFLGFRDIIDL